MDDTAHPTDDDIFVFSRHYRRHMGRDARRTTGQRQPDGDHEEPPWADSPNVSLDEARRMGDDLSFSTLCVVNLFARRSPKPPALNSLPYALAVHESNDDFISMGLEDADLVVAAWGAPNGIEPRTYRRRLTEVVKLVGVDRFASFGVTAKGHPRHCQDWRRRGRGPLTDWSAESVHW